MHTEEEKERKKERRREMRRPENLTNWMANGWLEFKMQNMQI